MDSTCEAFELDYSTCELTDEDEFESKLKAQLPSGAKYVVRCAQDGLGAARYTLLVWLKEAQSVDEVTQWLANVVVYGSGDERYFMSFPAENQTANEFVFKKYGLFFPCGLRAGLKCRGNVQSSDIELVLDQLCQAELRDGVDGRVRGELIEETYDDSDSEEFDEFADDDKDTGGEPWGTTDCDRCGYCGTTYCDLVVLGGIPCRRTP
jgi:hypothetical protein